MLRLFSYPFILFKLYLMKHLFLFIVTTLSYFSFNTVDPPAGLKVGDVAPDFSGSDQHGKKIQLKESLKSGPVVVLFYRGEWCPYCNRQLQMLQDSLQFITGKGASVIAITPENSENRTKTIAKTKASFHILSDDHSSIMHAYGVAFTLDEKTTAQYKGYGIVLSERNGTNGNELPVPAVYIVNKKGRIAYRHFDTDYTKRASIKEIVEHL